MKANTAQLIYDRVKTLPETTQRNVLDFVEYLWQKDRQENALWSSLSVATALRGMEDETWPEYSDRDFKQRQSNGSLCTL